MSDWADVKAFGLLECTCTQRMLESLEHWYGCPALHRDAVAQALREEHNRSLEEAAAKLEDAAQILDGSGRMEDAQMYYLAASSARGDKTPEGE